MDERSKQRPHACKWHLLPAQLRGTLQGAPCLPKGILDHSVCKLASMVTCYLPSSNVLQYQLGVSRRLRVSSMSSSSTVGIKERLLKSKGRGFGRACIDS